MNSTYADIYIIPNPIGVYDSKNNAIDGCKHHNMDDLGLQVCFEACIVYDDFKNLNNNVYNVWGRSLSRMMPIEIFIGKKEGDTIKLDIDYKEIIVTCAQLKYQYADHGNFETTLYNLTKSFYNLNDENNYKQALSKRSQMALILATHEKYARSIGFEPTEPTKFRYARNYINQCKLDAIAVSYICSDEQSYIDSSKKENVSLIKTIDNYISNKLYSWSSYINNSNVS